MPSSARGSTFHSLAIKMAQTRFSSFARASAFAKTLARRGGQLVRVRKDGADWVMEPVEKARPKVQHVEKAEEKIVPPTITSRPVTTFAQPASKPIKRPPRNSAAPSSQAPRAKIPTLLAPGERVCLECSGAISAQRAKAVPGVIRCVGCQSKFESGHDGRARIDEGIAGTRKDNKRMRGQLWGDMRNRSRGR
jgi:hypothetical protein